MKGLSKIHKLAFLVSAELLSITILTQDMGHGTGTRSTGRVSAGDDNNSQTARNPPQI